MRSRKRSSCASGSGYVPSYSIGFWVASTRNGRSSGRVTPSIVTCRSCIASSSAACVFGGARLISSASSRFVKIGPGAELEVAVALVPDRRARHVGRQQVGRELDAAEAEPARLREGARGQGLREPGDVLEQDVPVGEQAEQHELELLALADDGALDLVEEAAAQLGESSELHQMRSSDVTTRSRPASSMPALELVGRLRPVRPDELPDVVTEHGVGPIGLAVEVDAAARREQVGRELRRARGEGGEWTSNAEEPADRDLALEVRERARAGSAATGGRRRPATNGDARRRVGGAGEAQEREQARDRGRRGARRGLRARSDRERARARPRARSSGAPGARPRAARGSSAPCPLAELGGAAARCCSARSSAARSSSRTASSASIASSFISGATSCAENFAHVKSAVKREVARRLTSRSAKMRSRYSSGASAGLRGRP